MGASTAVVAAQAAISAASAYGEHKAGKVQESIAKTEATLEHAQTEFALSRKAATESEEYRRALASTIASASARGGASLARQFGGQYESSFAKDFESINRAYVFNDISKQNKFAQAEASRATNTFGAISGLGKSILGTAPLAFGAPKAAAPIDNSAIATYKPRPSHNPFAPTSNFSGTQSGLVDILG